MDDPECTHLELRAVPLFPLPNVVLFPRAVLPLHVFEERYKTMTAAALSGDKQIAMALLRPGWEKSYYGRPAIEAVVCIGRILTHEKLPDGKYNLLLQGHTRARVVRERAPGQLPYRLATLEPIPQTRVLEIDLGEYRDRLNSLFHDGPLAGTCLARQFRQMLSSPLTTADIVDLIAFNVLEDVAMKQELLSEGDVHRRMSRALRAVQEVADQLSMLSAVGAGVGRDDFGPGHPEMN